MPSAGVANGPDGARAGEGEGAGAGDAADGGGEVLVRSAGIAERGAGEVLVRSPEGAVAVRSSGSELTAAPQTEQYREFGPISLEHAGQLGTSASYQSVPRSTQSPAPSSGQTVHLVLRDADLFTIARSGSRDADLRGCSPAHGTRISADAHLLTGRGSPRIAHLLTGRGSPRIAHLLTGRGSPRIAHLLTGRGSSRIAHLHTGRGSPRIARLLTGRGSARIAHLLTGRGSSRMRSPLMLMGDQILPGARAQGACTIRTNRPDCSRIWPFSGWLWICLCSRHDGRTWEGTVDRRS